MDTRGSFNDIILIQVANIYTLCPVVQIHSKIYSSILKTKAIHKIPPFRFRDDGAFTIRLFDNNYKFVPPIPSVSKNSQERIRENSIVDNNTI